MRMLTAWDKIAEKAVAVPDFEESGGLGLLRTRTRQGELVCPTCQQLLWLRAGEVLIPHFAHRRLSECPHGRVSEVVLTARRLIYRFFRARIDTAQLPGEIQLEPVLEGVLQRTPPDLLLRRRTRSCVAIKIIESTLKPDLRFELPAAIQQQKWLFRPIFLSSRIRRAEDGTGAYLLDPAQRELRLSSAYDLRLEYAAPSPGTLHFLDPHAASWTTLRALWLVHNPQVFEARSVHTTHMDHLLWSEAHSEWAHPGEPEALKELKEQIAAKRREEAARIQKQRELERELERQRKLERERAARKLIETLPPLPPQPRPPPVPESPKPVVSPRAKRSELPIRAPRGQNPEPLPEWLTEGMVCYGCGKRTKGWQIADPSNNTCVCRACFASGTRLPR
jgi:hypothetical protein